MTDVLDLDQIRLTRLGWRVKTEETKALVRNLWDWSQAHPDSLPSEDRLDIEAMRDMLREILNG